VYFTDERLRHTEVEGRDDECLASTAELYVPLLGSTQETGIAGEAKGEAA
jgi:hypothetical protein